MKRLGAVLGALIMILLAGCSLGTPTPIPSNTPTQSIFIRVATPTPSGHDTPTSSPTIEPTQVDHQWHGYNIDPDRDPDINPDTNTNTDTSDGERAA